MLKSGDLNSRLTRFGTGSGSPPSWPNLGSLWAKLVAPKSAGRESQSSIYASGTTFITIRPRAGILPGQLLKHGDDWYLIEDINTTPGEMQIAARKLAGEPAQYTPKGGEPYAISAWLAMENILVGARSEPRQQIDLILPELIWPFARIGDQIAMRGRNFRIEGKVEGSDNGTTIRVMVS